MKIKDLTKTYDYMPQNVHDLDNAAKQASRYDILYQYALDLEGEVRRLREDSKVKLHEVRMLNSCIQRKNTSLSRIKQIVVGARRFLRFVGF